MTDHKWRLPDGVDQVLAPHAWQLELLRRRVLDVCRRWGFDYVDPPMIEFVDSLLVGGDDTLDLQTLKVVDQLSGRLMGVRADMTAQAVRIDAHSGAQEPARLCYAGTVVQAMPFGVHGSRIPLKAGAEIFGVADNSADAEVIALLVDILQDTGMAHPTIVLGHMGIYRSLVADFALTDSLAATLLAAVQRKSENDIAELLPAGPHRDLILQLPRLMGDESVFTLAREAFGGQHPKAEAALAELEALAAKVQERSPGVQLHFDLAEISGYGYHNGPLFAAYHPQVGRAVARGGRYDNLGAAFGAHSRAATGFDINLKPLLAMASSSPQAASSGAIWAQPLDDHSAADFNAQVQQLRSAGERVVVALLASETPADACDRQLQQTPAGWQVVPLATSKNTTTH